MAIDPELAIAIAEDVLEKYMIPFYELLLADTASYVNVVGISDDLGSETGLLFSPAMYRKIFKPLHRRLIEFIRSKTDARIYMHSDGSIYDIIPDLIEIGVDGLNPVQYTAKGMELERLVREFGKDLGFYGGVVENEILSFSPPEEITELARRNVATLKQEKAFIFAPIHNISQEVPPENIVALYQAGLAFGKY
jgi:uroporphyrinogen decarboxylase